MSNAVSLGTKLGLVVSAYSVGVLLDLHLVKCEARDEEGRVVVLLKVGTVAYILLWLQGQKETRNFVFVLSLHPKSHR